MAPMRIVALILSLGLLLPAATAVVAAAKAAPQFSATTLSGQAISLAAFKGKAVVLLFWAPW